METDQQPSTTPKPTPLASHHFQASTPFPVTPALNSAAKKQHLFSDNEGIIYGTNICFNEVMDQIRYFFLNFEVTMEKDDQFITEKIYLVKLRDLEVEQSFQSSAPCFDVDASHIEKFSQKLYLQLVYFPVQIISCLDKALQELYDKEFIETETDPITLATRNRKRAELRVGIVKLSKRDSVCIKDLVPTQLGRLVSLTGIVIRMSEIYPQMKVGYFCCNICKQIKTVALENARVEQPKQCPRCRKQNSYELIHNQCQFTNKQYIKFQELLQNVSQGQSPASVTLLAYDSNVDKIRPGDSVEVTGIYRCNMLPICRNRNVYRSVFGTYFDVISFEILKDKTRRIESKDKVFTEQERRQFMKIANNNQVINNLAMSFAPSIYGHKEVKKGILAQLFGGSKASLSTKGQHRSEINILLVGDPSTAKSQMLQQVHRIAPRSVYTCGRGSTSVGLTANVRKDPETRQFVLQSGALVLSDEGVCCIDEFDKMKENVHTVLLEVMEQQTISIAKAGIVCQLNSRTAVLAAANPIHSKYNPKKSVIENIYMPPALLSRFDLIYIMLDVPNQEEDRRIAMHILDMYSDNPQTVKKKGIYSLQLLSNFVSYARKVKPVLGPEAADKIKKQYLKLRAEGQSFNTISATPRLLESMIRLSEAFAKMRLSTEVSAEDAEQAIDIINFATLKSATDPETGLVDMDMIATGKTTHMKKRIEQLSQVIKNLLQVNESKYYVGTQVGQLHEDFKKMNPLAEYSKDEVLQALRLLDGDNLVVVFKDHRNRQMFKLRQINQD